MPGTASGGFDLKAIDPEYKTEILDGLVGSLDSMFTKVFAPKIVNQLSGKVPYLPSKFSLRGGADAESSRVAIDGDPVKLEGGLADADFRFDHKYAAENSIHKTTVAQSGDFDSPETLLGHIQAINMIQIAGDVDADGATILQSAVLNTAQAAVAVWSDTTNARPVQDLDALMDIGGDAYTHLWLGESEVRELGALPALVSFANNYSAVDARAPKPLIANWLFQRYNHLQEIVLEGQWYNTAQLAATVATARQFDGTVWAGKGDQLITVEFGAMRETDEGYNSRSQKFWAMATLYIDATRGEGIMGAVLTGF